MKNKVKRSVLNSTLFLVCRSKAVAGYGDENEAARIIREAACRFITERTRPDGMALTDCNALSDEEIQYCIDYVKYGKEPKPRFPLDKDAYASVAKRGKVRYLSLQCGLYYATFDSLELVDESTGEVLKGEVLRDIAKAEFAGGQLRGALLKHVFNTWIHPKIHRFLYESKLRYETRYPKSDYYLKWDELTDVEADMLIKRFQRMYNEILTRYEGQKPDTTIISN